MNSSDWNAWARRQPALFALVLLVLALAINLFFQPNMFSRDTLNSNMRVFLPIILMAVGQAIVILGGGIDISVGGIASIVNTSPPACSFHRNGLVLTTSTRSTPVRQEA